MTAGVSEARRWVALPAGHVVAHPLDEHVALYHRGSGHTLLLDAAACIGWSCVGEEPADLETLCHRFADQGGQAVTEELRSYMAALLEMLRGAGLIRYGSPEGETA